MKLLPFIIILVGVTACSHSNDDTLGQNTLNSYVGSRSIEMGGVIACSASEAISNAVLTFFYPEDGATNFRYFETENVTMSNNDFNNYTPVSLESEPVFNGYLRFFTNESVTEKWIIVTYELNGDIKIANPIKTKQLSKPTVWNNEVSINQEVLVMPKFEWQANAFGDNAIYFQVLTNADNDLLSGTYTYENMFQYYNTSNVVLNITQGVAEGLVSGSEYNFTLMDVSIDNWVNLVVQKTFTVQ